MRTYSNFGRWKEAEEVAHQGLKHNPDDAELKAWAAFTMFFQARVEEARRLLEAAARDHPDSPYPYIGLVEAARRQQLYDEARMLVVEALARMDESEQRSLKTDQLFLLGLSLVQIPGEQEWAVKILEKATEVPGSRDPRAHALLSELLADEQPQAAKEHLARARGFWRGDEASFQRYIEGLKKALSS